jgi:hypothetical protein
MSTIVKLFFLCTLSPTKIHRPESPEPEVTCGTVAIIIRVVLLSLYLHIRGVSVSSMQTVQSKSSYKRRSACIYLCVPGLLLILMQGCLALAVLFVWQVAIRVTSNMNFLL